MAQTVPGTRPKKEILRPEETAGEGGERKSSTGRRSLTEASSGIVGRKEPIPKKRGQIPTAASRSANHDKCNKHIPVGVSLNGERLIVVHIVIVDYLHSLVGGSLIIIRPEGTKSNH